MVKLSVIIPSYKDPLLQRTIDSLLANSKLGDQLEVIAVLDGYWQLIKDDPRVRIVHIGKNSGMREAINSGVRIARGEYLMRTDEHCIFSLDYDKILTDDCKDNWIMTPRRYFLDTEKWEIMDIPPVDYMKLKIVRIGQEGDKVEKFSGVEWKRNRKKLIDETMAMQGSCWVMKHNWWDKVIGELQSEGYDTHYQDSHEMQFKTWKAGGKLMVNKKCWYAHKHRKFPRTHGYGGEPARKGFAYALSVWRDYFEKEIQPKWMQQ